MGKFKCFSIFFCMTFFVFCYGQNPSTCYYEQGGRLYTNSAHTSPAGGLTAAGQCFAGYSGIPYFYENPSPPASIAQQVACLILSGNYYKVLSSRRLYPAFNFTPWQHWPLLSAKANPI